MIAGRSTSAVEPVTGSGGGLPGLLSERAAARPDAVALRYKRRGLWRTVRRAELVDGVATAARRLRALGVRTGDAVALVGDLGPGWVVTDLAIQALGGRSVALAAQIEPRRAVELLARSGVGLVVAGSAAQARALTAAGDLPVVISGTDATGELRRLGETTPTVPPSGITGVADTAGPAGLPAGGGSAVVTVFSDGADGDPVPADLPAAGVAELAVTCADLLGVTGGDRIVPVLPPSTPAARVLDLYVPLASGAQLLLPESPATVAADLLEAEPTVLCLSARALELLHEASESRTHRTAGLRRRILDRGMRALHDRIDRDPRARTPDGAAQRRGAWYAVVGRWVARHLGLHRTRRIVLTGGPAAQTDLRFFWSLGVPVLAAHGGAPVAGLGLLSHGMPTGGVCGAPLPGTGAELDHRSVLLLHTPVTGPGGHDTGEVGADAGPDGFRVRGALAGRIGELYPAELESALRESPYIRRARVLPGAGPDDPGPVALIEIDPDVTGRWAVRHDVAFSTFRSLVTAPAVRSLIETEAAAAAPAVRRWVLSDAPLSVDAGELTALLAVRRSAAEALLGR